MKKGGGKKNYIGIFFLLAVFITTLFYWYKWKPAAKPAEITLESGEAIEQDISDLGDFEQDKSLDSLDFDLSWMAGEKASIETSSVEKMEKELSSELAGISVDSKSLDAVISDISLDDMESELSNI